MHSALWGTPSGLILLEDYSTIGRACLEPVRRDLLIRLDEHRKAARVPNRVSKWCRMRSQENTDRPMGRSTDILPNSERTGQSKGLRLNRVLTQPMAAD